MVRRYQVLLTAAQREAVLAALGSVLAGPIGPESGHSQRHETFEAAEHAVHGARLVEVADA